MKVHFQVFILSLISTVAFSQAENDANNSNYVPPSPKAASIAKFTDANVNLSMGSVSQSVPLFNISHYGISIPISADYNYTGFRPGDEPSEIGLGWSLSAGGMVSRSQRGNYDEGENGYLQTAAQINPCGDDFGGCPQLYQNITSGNFDMEPDIFSFNVMGHSGKFFFGADGEIHMVEQKPYKITYEIGGESGVQEVFLIDHIGKWVISAPDGNRFIFESKEFTWGGDFSTRFDKLKYSLSSWYLSKIEGIKGEEIFFEYTGFNNLTKLHFQISQSERKTLGVNSTTAAEINFNDYNRLSYNASIERYISKIYTNDWEVNFQYSAINKQYYEVDSDYLSLDKVDYHCKLPGEEKLINSFLFDYHDPATRKLLKSITEQSRLGSRLPPYKFDYFNRGNISFEPSLRSIDYWGFYNGALNSSLLTYNGANREPSLFHTQYYAMKSIEFPTGSRTEFEYELNEAGFTKSDPIEAKKRVYSYDYYRWNKVGEGDGVWEIENEHNIYIDTETFITGDWNIVLDDNACAVDFNRQRNLASSTPLTSEDFITNKCLILTNPVVNNPVGNVLELRLTLEKIITINSESEDVNSKFGGLRIKKISTIDNFGSPTKTKDYFYKMSNDPDRSSGVAAEANFEAYQFYYALTENSSNGNGVTSALYTGFVFKSDPINPMFLTALRYKEVEEVVNNSYITQYKFYSYEEVEDKPGFYVPKAPAAANNFFNIGPVNSFEYLRGIPKETLKMNENGFLVEKSTFQNFTVSEITNPIQYYKTYGYSTENLGSYKLNQSSEIFVPLVHIVKYETGSAWNRDKTNYSESRSPTGELISSQIVNSFYLLNSKHLQKSKTETLKSNGDKAITELKYPSDYEIYSNSAVFINEMVDRNMLVYPIQTIQKVEKPNGNTIVTNASISTFKLWNGVNGKQMVLPYKNYIFQGLNGDLSMQAGFNSSTYDGTSADVNIPMMREAVHFTAYDERGNPVSLIMNESDKNSYLWSYNGHYMVAQAKNAGLSELNSALGSLGLTKETFSQLTNSTAVENITSQLQGLLPGTLIGSYLYNPMIGVFKETAPNGISSNYEYDEFNRLKLIKDNNGKIVKSYNYNYVGQGQ